ncbi:hypothetical protein MMC30_005641 [Trapelia coarctata]|nr:hypothetical protein [Trapelia coarctata]
MLYLALSARHIRSSTPFRSPAATVAFGRQFLPRSPSIPRIRLSSKSTLIDSNQKVEEEEFGWYSPAQYYPVRLGEVFNSRYQVIGKLGYGAHSNLWLCKDLEFDSRSSISKRWARLLEKEHKYVTLKVCERDSIQTTREVEAYKYLNTITTRHEVRQLIRSTLDTFEIRGPEGNHQCLVHKPLGLNLKPSNILFDLTNESLPELLEAAEMEQPCPRKIDGDRTIYRSRNLGDLGSAIGRPVLCDFGEARYGKELYTDLIQPFVYWAPEVDLRIPWDHKVDIWNVGMMDKDLIDGTDATGKNSREHKLAELIALLGTPPKHFLDRSEVASEYFDEQGRWKGTVDIPSISLEDTERHLEGDQKVMSLQFMRRMLKWVPEERQSAKELLGDPWLFTPGDGAASTVSGNSALLAGLNASVLSVSVPGPVSPVPARPFRLCESHMNIPSTPAAAGSPRPKPAPSATGSAFWGSGDADADGVEAAADDDEVEKDVAVVREVTEDIGMIVITAGKEEVNAVGDRMIPFPAAQHEVFETPQHQLPSTHFNISIEEDAIPAAKDRSKTSQPSPWAEVKSVHYTYKDMPLHNSLSST